MLDGRTKLSRGQSLTMWHMLGALPFHCGDGVVPRRHHARGADSAGARVWAALVHDNRDGAQRGNGRAKGNEGFPGKGRVGQLGQGGSGLARGGGLLRVVSNVP